GQVARGADKTFIGRRPVDDQDRVPAKRGEPRAERLGLGVIDLRGLDDDELALSLLRRERGLQTEPADLFLQVEAVAAHDRPKDHRTAAELRRAQTALARPPGALLLVGLL